MKDAAGRIIGFEKLNVVLEPGERGLTVEIAAYPPNGGHGRITTQDT